MKKSKVYGVFEHKKLLQGLPDKVERRVLQRAVMRAARAGAKIVRKNTPRDQDAINSQASQRYGPAYKNIRVIRLKRVPKGTKAARIDTGNAFWIYIYEKGSRHQPARPWFGQTIKLAEDTIIRVLGDEITKGIEDQYNPK